jgi:hypothetical protein
VTSHRLLVGHRVTSLATLSMKVTSVYHRNDIIEYMDFLKNIFNSSPEFLYKGQKKELELNYKNEIDSIENEITFLKENKFYKKYLKLESITSIVLNILFFLALISIYVSGLYFGSNLRDNEATRLLSGAIILSTIPVIILLVSIIIRLNIQIENISRVLWPKIYTGFISQTKKINILIQNRKTIVDTFEKDLEIYNTHLKEYQTNFKEYWSTQLENFQLKHLYTKRSSNIDFDKNLSIYGSMIDFIKKIMGEINSSAYFIDSHIDYYNKRITNISRNFKEKNDKFMEEYIQNKNTKNTKIKEENTSKTFKTKEFEIEYTKPQIVKTPRVVENKTPLEHRFRTARKINWEGLFQEKMKTGLKGEEIIFQMEKDYLQSIGKYTLASSVNHVSVEQGDGLGYDILSFFSDGRKKYIEVKTTSQSITSSYNISRNELSFLKENPEQSFIYRLSIKDESEPLLEIIVAQDFLIQKELVPISYQVK